MKRQQTVYLETSTISFLTAKPSDNPVLRGKQILTEQWWEQRNKFEMFISQTVFDEIVLGDKTAAMLRKAAVVGISVLPTTDEVEKLVDRFMDAGVFPATVRADAYHVAIAAVHQIDILLTWNQKHIATNAKRRQIEDVILKAEMRLPKLLTPEQHLLLEMNSDVYGH